MFRLGRTALRVGGAADHSFVYAWSLVVQASADRRAETGGLWRRSGIQTLEHLTLGTCCGQLLSGHWFTGSLPPLVACLADMEIYTKVVYWWYDIEPVPAHAADARSSSGIRWRMVRGRCETCKWTQTGEGSRGQGGLAAAGLRRPFVLLGLFGVCHERCKIRCVAPLGVVIEHPERHGTIANHVALDILD